jgi:cobalt-zinc-cadmium efflux system protein
MGHQHEHGMGASGHGVNRRRTFWAALLTGGFMLAEVVGGLISGSLALLADAAHMLTDTASLSLAWLAFRLAERPADDDRTFGYHRFQILVAFANAITLFLIIAWIFVEAVHRLYEPVEVLGSVLLMVALVGLAINVIAFALLHGADRENLNIRGAMLHVLGDLLGSLAALIAGAVILTTGWMPIDPLLSMVVGLILFRSAWRLAKESGHILLEGTPAGVAIEDIKQDLVSHVPGLVRVHHVHAWSLTQSQPLLTLHAEIADGQDPLAAIKLIKSRLLERFDIDHATVEIECTT